MNNNTLKSISDILDNKAPASDGLSSLRKNEGTMSSLLFSLNNTDSLPVLTH